MMDLVIIINLDIRFIISVPCKSCTCEFIRQCVLFEEIRVPPLHIENRDMMPEERHEYTENTYEQADDLHRTDLSSVYEYQ